jgi:hypothetical protein
MATKQYSCIRSANDRTADSRVLQSVELHKEDILDPIAVRDSICNLKGVYKDNSYIDAQVSFSALPRPENRVIGVFGVVETAQQYSWCFRRRTGSLALDARMHPQKNQTGPPGVHRCGDCSVSADDCSPTSH